MHFYVYIYVKIFFLSIYIKSIDATGNPNLIVSNKRLEQVSPCSMGLQFHVDVNNTSEDQDFDVELTPDQCCLDQGSILDCDVLEIIGNCVDLIPRGKTKTLKLVAPLLDPYERKGYCVAFLDSKSAYRNRVMRDSVRINFDTRLTNKKLNTFVTNNLKTCHRIDEDPLNDCKPVNCEEHYNGKKSYYNRRFKRCVEVPACVTDEEELPNVIYNPVKNECVHEESVSDDDVDFVKSIVHGNTRKPKDVVIIKNVNTKDFIHHNRKDHANSGNSDKNRFDTLNLFKYNGNSKSKCSVIAKYFSANKYMVCILGVVILIQCCFIFTMIFYVAKNCLCCKKKKTLVRQYFNFRQDASVTTPLIATSNIDTETTEHQYQNESSNIDNKIQCYKACQKDKNVNAVSLSDDILSKCLNRRDWKSKSAKSELMQEFTAKISQHKDPNTKNGRHETNVKSNEYETRYADVKKQSDSKVKIENEKDSIPKRSKSNRIVKSIVKKLESACSKKKPQRTTLADSEIVFSEKEIKCHSYNYMEGHSRGEASKHTCYKQCSSETSSNGDFRYSNQDQYMTDKAPSIEKAAQACFSNDSMDDFLSDRLARENTSKDSFSINSNNEYSGTSVSSRTSKNNKFKNMLSLLKMRAKHGPSSDPGIKKSQETGLELIHISHATIYSSSNNGSDCLKNIKRVEDSRSSL